LIRDCSKREQRLIYEISFVVKCAAGIPGQGQGRARRAHDRTRAGGSLAHAGARGGGEAAGEDEAAKEVGAFGVDIPTDCV